MLHHFFLALLLTLFALGAPPKYKDGIQKPNGSKDCPAEYIPVTDYAECLEIAKGNCLSEKKAECDIWAKRVRDKSFAPISDSKNQPGCYFDQGNGVLFNGARTFDGKFNENDDRPICKWHRPSTKFEFVKKGTCESAGFHSIFNQEECKEAANVFVRSHENNITANYGFTFSTGEFGNHKPTGCSWVPSLKKVELFEFSTGDCRIDGSVGCFCTNEDFYTTGVRKLSGSTACPPYYSPVTDIDECKHIALGKCLSKDAEECDIWTKFVLTDTFAKNHGSNNQYGCSFDENTGILFNTNRIFSGKHNEKGDRPICKKDSETFGESKIIKMLRGLIAEAQKEITDVESAIIAAQKVFDQTNTELSEARGKETEAKRALDDSLKVLNIAKGAHSSAERQYKLTAPGLESEIALFKEVIAILKSLTDGQELVEKNKVNVTAFISLADQANPDKINEVLVLLQNLIDTAVADLGELGKAVRGASAALKRAQAAFYIAEGVWKSAVALKEEKETLFNRAKAQLDSAKTHAADRTPVLDGEIKSIEEAIVLIKSLED